MAHFTLLVALLCLLTSLAELWVVRRWYGRRSRAASVALGALIGAGLTFGLSLGVSVLSTLGKRTVDSMPGWPEILVIVSMLGMGLLLHFVAALFPAWIVAGLYARSRRRSVPSGEA